MKFPLTDYILKENREDVLSKIPHPCGGGIEFPRYHIMVRERGLEPLRESHWILSPARLPVPPLSHGHKHNTELYRNQGVLALLSPFFIRLRQNTLQLAAGMNGEADRAEAR